MLLLDLYAALRPIDAITGATTADDILNRIFRPSASGNSMFPAPAFTMGTSLIRPFLITVLSAAALANAQPRAPEGQLDASETLFTVMAAMDASGYRRRCRSPTTPRFRKQVRDIIEAKHLASVEGAEEIFRRTPLEKSCCRPEPVRLVRSHAGWPARIPVAPETGRTSAGCQGPGGPGVADREILQRCRN